MKIGNKKNKFQSNYRKVDKKWKTNDKEAIICLFEDLSWKIPQNTWQISKNGVKYISITK